MTDLTTIDAVKGYAGITTSVDDATLSALITSYSDWVRSFTNRDFTANAYEIWRSGHGGQTLRLPQWPMTGLTLLEVDGRAVPAQAIYGGFGYRTTDTTIILEGGACFTRGHENVHVIFDAGYATVPADLAQAINELVALRYKMRDKLNLLSEGMAGQTTAYITRDMPASVATVLNQYARKVPL